MKKRIATFVILAVAVPLLVAFSVSIVGTGTVVGSTASTVSFSRPIRNFAIFSNRNTGANVAYFKINDAATTPTVSATSFDFVLAQNGTLTIGRDLLGDYPMTRVSVYSAETTPTIRCVGW